MDRPLERFSGFCHQLTIVAMVLTPILAIAIFASGDYEIGVAIFWYPVIIFLNLLLVRQCSTGDPYLQQILFPAYLFKLLGVAVYIFLTYHYFSWTDMTGYVRNASHTYELFFLSGYFPPFMEGSGFIVWLVSGIALVTTPSMVVLNLIFATCAFWGTYFAYRSFVLAFPNGRRGFFAILIFLSPSILFWTAATGKDAVIMLGLPLATYGYMKLARQPGTLAFVYMALGFGLVGMTRPHIAGMAAIGFGFSYAFGSLSRSLGAVLVKMFALPILVVLMVVLVQRAESYVNSDKVGSVQALENVSKNSSIGATAQSNTSWYLRLSYSPFIFFRPFPWEIKGVLGVIACAEGILTLVIFWRFRSVVAFTFRRWQQTPMILFIAVFGTGFSIVMSSAISNLGIFLRQRTMLLPFALMVVCTYSPEAVAAELAKKERSRLGVSFRKLNAKLGELADPWTESR